MPIECSHLQTLGARVYEGDYVESVSIWARIMEGEVAMAVVSCLHVAGVLYSGKRKLEVGGGILYVLTHAVEWVQGNGNGRDEPKNISLMYSLRLYETPFAKLMVGIIYWQGSCCNVW